jgi:hypothetical protein
MGKFGDVADRDWWLPVVSQAGFRWQTVQSATVIDRRYS